MSGDHRVRTGAERYAEQRENEADHCDQREVAGGTATMVMRITLVREVAMLTEDMASTPRRPTI